MIKKNKIHEKIMIIELVNIKTSKSHVSQVFIKIFFRNFSILRNN